MGFEITTFIVPGLFLLGFIFAVASAATPFATLEFSGATYEWHVIRDCYAGTCAEGSGLNAECSAFRSTRGADAAFIILTCLCTVFGGAFAGVRIFLPQITKGPLRLIAIIVGGVIIFFAFLSGILGIVLFAASHCNVNLNDSGANLGAQGPLALVTMLVGIAIVVCEYMFGMKDTSGEGSSASAEGGSAAVAATNNDAGNFSPSTDQTYASNNYNNNQNANNNAAHMEQASPVVGIHVSSQ